MLCEVESLVLFQWSSSDPGVALLAEGTEVHAGLPPGIPRMYADTDGGDFMKRSDEMTGVGISRQGRMREWRYRINGRIR